jgi:hypothetical protein
MPRYFIRCTDCLSIGAVDADTMPNLFSVVCGACGGHLENMGRVEKDRLKFDGIKCACDDRCTSARGPICSCHCGGKNHGAGLLAYIRYTVDAGKVPTLTVPNTLKARRTVEEFRSAMAKLDAELDYWLTEKRTVGFLPAASFNRLRLVQSTRIAAYKAREHQSRMRKLYAVIGQPTPTTTAISAPLSPSVSLDKATQTRMF